MNKKILYLINPISGTSEKGGIAKLIASETEAKGLAYLCMDTPAHGDFDLIRDKVLSEQFTTVVAVGGDGTVNQVTGALRDLPVHFGIIPCGSGNGLALSAGIPRKIEDSLALIFDGEPRKTDAFLVNDRYACMLSGVGFDAHVAHDFAAKASRGLLTYTQQSLLNFFRAQPYQFEVILKDFTFFTDAFFISIANSNQFGNNVTIAPHARLDDGLLDIVIVQKMNKAKLPFAVLRQVRGNNQLQEMVNAMTRKNVLYFQTDALTIRNARLAPLHIDGEPAETAPELKIQVLESCFHLIRPGEPA